MQCIQSEQRSLLLYFMNNIIFRTAELHLAALVTYGRFLARFELSLVLVSDCPFLNERAVKILWFVLPLTQKAGKENLWWAVMK